MNFLLIGLSLTHQITLIQTTAKQQFALKEHLSTITDEFQEKKPHAHLRQPESAGI